MRTRSMAAPALVLAVLLAACGSGAASPSTAPVVSAPPSTSAAPSASEAPSAGPASEAPSASPSEAAGGGASIALTDTSLGSVLADAEGMVLYVFVPDNGGASTCYDACATAWPPLLTEGTPTVGEGLTAADVATTERTDGSTQVTFKGWPLYYFQGDAEAGQTNGQGLNDVWFVVDAEGTMVGAPSAAP